MHCTSSGIHGHMIITLKAMHMIKTRKKKERKNEKKKRNSVRTNIFRFMHISPKAMHTYYHLSMSFLF